MVEVKKSIVRQSLIHTVGLLHDIKDQYSECNPDKVYGDEGYTASEHVQYLQAKIECYLWAIDILKAAETP